MKIDKRLIYIWVVLANIGIYLILLILMVSGNGYPYPVTNLITESLTSEVVIISIIVSVIATWLSFSSLKLRNWIGFGVPFILLLASVYLWWSIRDCHESFCGLAEAMLSYYFVVIALSTLLFYAVGSFMRRLPINKVQSFMRLVYSLFGIILVSALVIVGNYAYVDAKISGSMQMTPSDRIKFCDSSFVNGRFSGRAGECWYETIISNAGVDVCSLATVGKESCLWVLYGTNMEACINSPGDFRSFSERKDDLKEYERIKDCWNDNIRKYPGLNTSNTRGPSCTRAGEDEEACGIFYKMLP